MSKKIIFIAMIVATTFAFAKRDVDMSKFNKELNKNIDTVIEHNPQMYETKTIQTRRPASVIEIHSDKDETEIEIEQVEIGHGKY